MDDTAQLHALQAQWSRLNAALFGEGLRPVVVRLDDSRTRLAGWRRDTRTITVSRRLLARPWPVVVEVLKHEMAHQYAHEVLGAVDERAHGPAFRRVCAERGIDARAAGEPEPDSRVVARVKKLLALAESPEQHEAESAARLARRLMAEHQLARTDIEARPFCVAHVGRVALRFMAHEKLLAGILGQHFGVQCIWVNARTPDGRDGRMLELCGREEEVAVAEYVHAWLLATAERLWRAHKQKTRARGRGRFLSGVVLGFADQLAREAVENEQTGLVPVEDAEVSAFVARRHRHLRAGRRTRVRADASFEAGRRQGQKVRLARGVARKSTRLLEG